MLPVAIAIAWSVFFRSRVGTDFPTETPSISVGGRTFSVDIADTPDARTKGLSGRDGLAASGAMLFLFDVPDRYPFWMSGMRFPLDLAWIREGRIVGIKRDVPSDFAGIMIPDEPVDSVLETNAGALSDARIGDVVRFAR